MFGVTAYVGRTVGKMFFPACGLRKIGHRGLIMEGIGKRIRGLRTELGFSGEEFAARLGVNLQTLYRYERGQRTPDINFVQTVSELTGVSLSWLLTGGGARREEAALPGGGEGRSVWENPKVLPPSTESDPWKSTRWQEVPVIGLAACDIMGWFNPSPLAFRLPLTVDHPYTPELFAVIAVGESMRPEGIREGFVLYCDPGAPLNPEDVVYIETSDGRASVKKFLDQEAGHIVVQGWLDPDPSGAQKPFTIKLSKTDIKRLAPVVVVKRKA